MSFTPLNHAVTPSSFMTSTRHQQKQANITSGVGGNPGPLLVSSWQSMLFGPQVAIYPLSTPSFQRAQHLFSNSFHLLTGVLCGFNSSPQRLELSFLASFSWPVPVIGLLQEPPIAELHCAPGASSDPQDPVRQRCFSPFTVRKLSQRMKVGLSRSHC